MHTVLESKCMYELVVCYGYDEYYEYYELVLA